MTGVRLKTQDSATRSTSATLPKRILMGVPSAGATAGGPALHLPMLVEDLQRVDVEVITFSFGRWAEGEPRWLKMWHQFLDLCRYPNLVRSTAPDLVHINSSLDRRALVRDVPFALVTRWLRVPLFVKWHGSEIELLRSRSPIWRGLAGLLLRNTSEIGVLSREEESALRECRNAPQSRVVRNALDLRLYDRVSDVRARLGVPADAPLLLFISRLIPAKGLLDVLRGLPDAAAKHNAHLVVVGDGPDATPARALVRELGLGDVVHFAGKVTERAALDYYCGCDVLVFPTYHAEGFPMTVFQSVAAGLGVVTTRIRAVADYLTEPEHCLFVPPRDPAALSLALERLLSDRELLDGMRRRNRELARRFERCTVAKEFAAIYSEMLLSARSRSLSH